jgi:hypothetical protein
MIPISQDRSVRQVIERAGLCCKEEEHATEPLKNGDYHRGE